MGASNSREGTLSASDSEDDLSSNPSTPAKLRQATPDSDSFYSPSAIAQRTSPSPSPSLMAADLSLNSLSLNGSFTPSVPTIAAAKQTAKLYRHIGGNTAKAQWIVAEKVVRWRFVRDRGAETDDDEEGDVYDDEEGDLSDEEGGFRSWNLQIGKNVKARVGSYLQMKYFDDQLRVDFVHKGVWALKFFTLEDYNDFVTEFQNCTFENTYLLEATEENKMKVFGKDFMDWANPNSKADESVWEDAEDGVFEKDPSLGKKDLKEAFNETSSGGIQSLVMGALDHSFLVSDNGIEAVKNMASGVRGKGNTVKYEKTMVGVDSNSTPRKAMLMRGEMNMMLLSPAVDKLHSSGVHQLDLPTGKVVAEWKFEKDGTPITMLDMTNESKGSQLDVSESTFLGLDDNRLCRWDMRDRHGIVQDISSPVLNWADGHQFSRGTNFQCFATTGDGFVAVGSKDGKVRLYGNSSMRMAKTAFPGLGSPITHIDVTFDGKWVLATTDSYLILISTMFKDKDGKTKTGFSGRGGNKFAPPRLLKLTPLDAHLAGPDNKLRNGQFSWVTESGKHERHLVATAGKFSVIWNFQRVKEGDESHECYRNAKGFKCCYCYKVVLREVSVVDSKFMHDKFTVDASPDEAPLVVATPNKVSSFNMWRD